MFKDCHEVGPVKSRLPPKETFTHKDDSKTRDLECCHCRKMYDEREGHMCLFKDRFYTGPVEDYVEPRYRECGQCWLIYDVHEGHMCRRPMQEERSNCTLQ